MEDLTPGLGDLLGQQSKCKVIKAQVKVMTQDDRRQGKAKEEKTVLTVRMEEPRNFDQL